MHIDVKSLIIGAVLGGCAVVFRASVAVARDRIKKDRKEREEA